METAKWDYSTGKKAKKQLEKLFTYEKSRMNNLNGNLLSCASV
jgi:hypothetical protein